MLYTDNRKRVVIDKNLINNKIINIKKNLKRKTSSLSLLNGQKFEQLSNTAKSKFNAIINLKNINLKKDLPTRFTQISDNLQYKIENILRDNIKDISLKQSSIWVKSITAGLIGGTIFGVVWLSIAKTEEIIILQGKLVPFGGVVDIKIPSQGIVKDILIKEGQLVNKNETLIQLDTEINESRQVYLNQTYEINKNILEKLNLLVQEGAISEIQYLQQKNKVSELKSKLVENSVALKYQAIKSPIKGYVFDLKPQKSGYVAVNGEPLMKIVPINKLQAKIEINSEKIGFVRVGQKADISIDSYPATDFGVIQGQITRIGSDALTPEPSLGKGFRFPADIKIEDQFLTLKNGRKLPLQTGMSLTANVKLRKVSYLQLLLGTFRDKADSLRSM